MRTSSKLDRDQLDFLWLNKTQSNRSNQKTIQGWVGKKNKFFSVVISDVAVYCAVGQIDRKDLKLDKFTRCGELMSEAIMHLMLIVWLKFMLFQVFLAFVCQRFLTQSRALSSFFIFFALNLFFYVCRWLIINEIQTDLISKVTRADFFNDKAQKILLERFFLSFQNISWGELITVRYRFLLHLVRMISIAHLDTWS